MPEKQYTLSYLPLFDEDLDEAWHYKDREYPYYRIPIRNFTVWYVVIDDVMEVRRFLYGKRKVTELL
ncbi:hypothetical protein AGMMS49983_18850 [Clostridia bacterium]|nr:hypothetical protein AGMMS49983_18800 [Clostridia bacterium]GHU67528.1 hypothetical protein AGMMS49983_18850 [Clostridia bacterium]